MKVTEVPAKPKEDKLLRVAAYARVSSEKDAAFHSLQAQVDYYEEYIAMHANWQLVDIYSDNGISGTLVRRPEFQRMLKDCRDGKIDLIVTKSVTRFARNTVVLLEIIRELKSLGIDVYFEKEDMHSISPDGELLLTLLAMYAEEEARSASENQLWRVQKKFENGEAWGGNMYGYQMVAGKLIVVPEEAEIVRQIYKDYLSGMGIARIAKRLNVRNVASPRNTLWSSSTVGRILSNERYIGNLILQKTYREDFRTKRGIINHGERRKYYVENAHEAIVSLEDFQAVQAEMKRRTEAHGYPTDPGKEKHDLFRGLLKCGFCGRTYISHVEHGNKKPKLVLTCPVYHKMGRQVCPSQRIPASILVEETKAVLGVEELDREILLERVKKIIVPEHNHLHYIFNDGTETDVYWKFPSVSESWTEEMREAARQRALAQFGKERN